MYFSNFVDNNMIQKNNLMNNKIAKFKMPKPKIKIPDPSMIYLRYILDISLIYHAYIVMYHR